jgi:hypothetical protein
VTLGSVAGLAALSIPGGSVPPQFAMITAFAGVAVAAGISRFCELTRPERLPWLLAAVHGVPTVLGALGAHFLVGAADGAPAASSSVLQMGLGASLCLSLVVGLTVFGVLRVAETILRDTSGAG